MYYEIICNEDPGIDAVVGTVQELNEFLQDYFKTSETFDVSKKYSKYGVEFEIKLIDDPYWMEDNSYTDDFQDEFLDGDDETADADIEEDTTDLNKGDGHVDIETT